MLVVQRNRTLFSVKDTALVLTHRISQTHGNLNAAARLLPVVSTSLLLDPRSWIHTMPTSSCTTTVEKVEKIDNIRKIGMLERILLKIRIMDIQKYRYMTLGFIVYEDVMSQIDYNFFYKYFNMPDTFVSWFLVTELHVWMIMVRYMAEGKNGQLIRNNVVTAMWEDVDSRVKNLGVITSTIKIKQVKEIWYQFNAAIIGYDEGIQSDDKVLAGALWRRFFYLECNNPEHVEAVLIYVRKQIALFDTVPTSSVMQRPSLKLIDIKSLCNPQ